MRLVIDKRFFFLRKLDFSFAAAVLLRSSCNYARTRTRNGTPHRSDPLISWTPGHDALSLSLTPSTIIGRRADRVHRLPCRHRFFPNDHQTRTKVVPCTHASHCVFCPPFCSHRACCPFTTSFTRASWFACLFFGGRQSVIHDVLFFLSSCSGKNKGKAFHHCARVLSWALRLSFFLARLSARPYFLQYRRHTCVGFSDHITFLLLGTRERDGRGGGRLH